MGRRQRERKEKKSGRGLSIRPVAANNVWWQGLLIVVIIIALFITGVMAVVYMNRERFVKVGVAALAQELNQKLIRVQGQYTYEDSGRIRKVLMQIEEIASAKTLDTAAAGQLMFVLQVIQEILQSEDPVKPEELTKLEKLTQETQTFILAKTKPGRALALTPIASPVGK
jgi:hypothetical protein